MEIIVPRVKHYKRKPSQYRIEKEYPHFTIKGLGIIASLMKGIK